MWVCGCVSLRQRQGHEGLWPNQPSRILAEGKVSEQTHIGAIGQISYARCARVGRELWLVQPCSTLAWTGL